MDAVRFDGIVRTLSQARSRRQALRSLAGAAGALALGARGASAQDEECKADGKECKKSSQCCSENCVGATSDKRGTCETAQTCIDPYHECPPACVDAAVATGNSAPCDACCYKTCYLAGVQDNCPPGMTTTCC